MRIKSIAAIAAVVSALGTLSASSAGISLTPGYYSGTTLITSTAGPCSVAAGDFYTETVFYPGPSKTGFVERSAFNFTDNSNNHWVGFTVYDFPTTPKAGVTAWTGTGTYHKFYAENGVNGTTAHGSFTFNATLTYVDALTFYVTGSSTIGSCTVNLQKTRTFSGVS